MSATETTKAKAKNTTDYVVLSSKTPDGPWEKEGEYSAHGQMAAKKLAAAAIGEDATELFFIAVPASSYLPQQPKVKVTTQISFLD